MTDKSSMTSAVQEKTGFPWSEYVKAAIIALGLALLIRTYVVQAFKIPSESMVRTLLVGDHLLVNKMVYMFGDPERGDIIVFRYPMDQSRDFVKRVVGLPGETVRVAGEKVFINGKLLDEPYAIYDRGGIGGDFGPVKVPAGHLFMMGDNRDNSQDSRVWGMLDVNLILGKAFIIHWSWRNNTYGVRLNRLGKLLK